MHANLPGFGEDYHANNFDILRWADAREYAGNHLGIPILVMKTTLELAIRSIPRNPDQRKGAQTLTWSPSESNHENVSKCQHALFEAVANQKHTSMQEARKMIQEMDSYSTSREVIYALEKEIFLGAASSDIKDVCRSFELS